LGLLASTAMAAPAFAQAQDTSDSPAPATNATNVTGETPQEQAAADGNTPDGTEIVVTAQKREENLQDVPVSIQAIGTRRLDQLNISNFEDYTKQLPSVSFQTSSPGSTVVYMRGVASGGDGNHSGSLPSVGTYLDEQPVTTIGGTLDVHIYDVARIESLAGPQGTLYGASSQAGTIRIITNKPELGQTLGRVDAELNHTAHGEMGGSLEGMVNVPVGDNIAFRAITFYRRDGGYIDNVFGERTYPFGEGPNDALTFDNSDIVDDDINRTTVYGGRAALKIDLNESWTLTPTVLHQNLKSNGVYYMDEEEDDLDVVRFKKDRSRDKFTQAALAIEGQIANFDVTYAGAYMDRPTYSFNDYTDYTDAYDAYAVYYGTYNGEFYQGLLDYHDYTDNAGNLIDPRQFIEGENHYKKMSHEVRIASPVGNRLRVLVGAFYQRQTNDIYQNYMVENLSTNRSVGGWPGTIWLTLQERVDKDYALFGEASFDLTPQITLTGGGRLFKYDNSLFGFAGFGATGGPGGFSSGQRRCLTVNGLQARDDVVGTPLAQGGLDDTPCTNVGNVVDGKLVPRRSKGSGFTHKVNAQFKPSDDVMLYATWSRGFRPGGINRQPNAPAYDPDYLTNYELGWKTNFGPVRWNGAVYHQDWKRFQFSFLGENSLTVIQNGRDARVRGIESDVGYTGGGFTLNAAAAYTDAKTADNICNDIRDEAEDCSTFFPRPTPTNPTAGDQDFILTPKGTRLPVTPKFKMAATGRYTFPMGPGRAHVQGSVSYQSSAAADIRQVLFACGPIIGEDICGEINPNDFVGRIRSSTLVDMYAGYNVGSYSFELFAKNVFDERNDVSRFVVCSICTQNKIVPGRPRTIGIRAGMKF
jgi:outer membrane receptor protein involved in Fe transport